MEWRVAPVIQAPALLHTEPALTQVEDALITPFESGPLYTEHGPYRWLRGAVYRSDGTLVVASQRHWNGDKQDLISANPSEVDIPEKVEVLSGRWLYAGHWSQHFGHFLLETLPNLWPVNDCPQVAGVIAHRPPRGFFSGTDQPPRSSAPLQRWQHDLIELAGVSPEGATIIHGDPVRVDHLVVPKRPVLLKRWASPEAVALWQKVSDAVRCRGPHSRVHFSRTRFHAGEGHARRKRTDPRWDQLLDEMLAQAGFHIAHAEELTISEQIELVRGAEVLSGLSGSALHLSVFARPGTRVLVIGDNRTPNKPGRAQTVVDSALGHRVAFVKNHDEDSLKRILYSLDTD